MHVTNVVLDKVFGEDEEPTEVKKNNVPDEHDAQNEARAYVVMRSPIHLLKIRSQLRQD